MDFVFDQAVPVFHSIEFCTFSEIEIFNILVILDPSAIRKYFENNQTCMKCGCIVLENPVPCKQFEYSYFKGYEKQSMISLLRHLSAIK